MTQQKKILTLKIQQSQVVLKSQRAPGQCIRVSCWPAICNTVQLISADTIKGEYKELETSEKAADPIKKSSNMAAKLIKLDVNSVRTAQFSF